MAIPGFNSIVPSYNNEFDSINRDFSDIKIVEKKNGRNCYIEDISSKNTFYNSILLEQNKRSKIVCEISFYRSSTTDKYIPRLKFERIHLKNASTDISKSDKKVTISLTSSDIANRFWRLMSFLSKFKEVVDLEHFSDSFSINNKDDIVVNFKNKNKQEKKEMLKELIAIAKITPAEFSELTFESRRTNLKTILDLLKNTNDEIGKYRQEYSLRDGSEAVWHHFLKNNDWLLGLNIELRFISDFIDEPEVGVSNSQGRGNPKADFLGISEFTTLVELKVPETRIFKKVKSKGRTNTWDFTADFIEGISQCLGQKFDHDKAFEGKEYYDNEGKLLDRNKIQTIDPRTILILGNKKLELPFDSTSESKIKRETFERFRRNNRNVEVLTYDELFERAYHIVFAKKLDGDWYSKEKAEILGEDEN